MPHPRSTLLLLAFSVFGAPIPAAWAQSEEANDPLEQLLGPITRSEELADPSAALGHRFGARISNHQETLAFSRWLAERSDRVTLVEHGESVEGRALFHLLVSAPQTLSQSDSIQQGLAMLADPRGHDPATIEERIRDLPAVTWLAYSVHGDEISCTDAALLTAWHLASAEGDELVDTVLANSIVGIDPLQNPDGRERFVFHARQTRGLSPDQSKLAAERDQPWPGGRVNHHLFDMNRDWFALTQPETRARVQLYQRWWPQVFVDLHEMGAESTYYFAPPAEPLNPEITSAQRDWLNRYGRGNASWFDRMGYDYFVREVFDAFYPGYGEGWPTFHGSVGMTFEQASPRGLQVELDNGDTLSYRDAIDHHFIASLGTCETTARNREEALRRFAEDRRTAIEQGRVGPVREFVFFSDRDPGRARRLAESLAFQGVEVRVAEEAFTNDRVREHGQTRARRMELPAESYVVRLDQPASRLATVLLTRTQDMDPVFLDEQRDRERRREPAEIYDLTGWSLPVLFGVDCYETEQFSHRATNTGDADVFTGLGAPLSIDRYEPMRLPDFDPEAESETGVAVVLRSGRNDTFRAVVALLLAGAKVDCAGDELEIAGETLPRGSILVKRKDNAPAMLAYAELLGRTLDLDPVLLDSSWTEDGPSLGSNYVRRLEMPRIALAWDRPTRANSAGAVRYLLEERYGLPVTEVRTERLRSADLDDFTVVILPNGGGYASTLGETGADNLRRFVRSGGTVIGLGGGATSYLASESLGLLQLDSEDRAKEDEAEGVDEVLLPEREAPQRSLGVLLGVHPDPRDVCAFGTPETIGVVSTDRVVYTPAPLDVARNVARFASRDELLLSGFTWPEKLDQLAGKTWLVHQESGRGHVIVFAEDPNLRAFVDGTNAFLMNSVLYAPAF